MGTWKGIIGASFTPASFDHYCHLLQWRRSFVVLPNPAVPPPAQRPDGLTRKHIRGLVRLHRAGPLTTPRRPSYQVAKASLLEQVQARLVAAPTGEHSALAGEPA